ncbi:MAG TPA: hypothetical protein ENL42_03510 [Thermoplasmatales archaeon]|nr:hypothetical protein [Thermoplasmatales archaeon]
MVKYSTISIPKELHEEIKRTVIDDPRYGYKSVAEFSLEAIKLRLDEIKSALEEEKGKKREKIQKIVENIKKKLR